MGKHSHGQGQGPSTIDKERQLASPLAVNMMIIAAKRPHDTYYHFDLNAGSGWNDEYGVPGTPLVFVELAERYLKHWEAMFFEINQVRARELETRLRGIPHCRVESIDNRHFMEWAGKLPRRAVGSLLADPNGWLYRSMEGVGSPVREIIECCEMLPSLDLIANMNVRHYRLMRGDIRHHPERAASYRRIYSLAEMPMVFRKRYGLVSNISSNGHGQFVRVILRNIPTNDHKALGWNLLNSPKALEIYKNLEETASERLHPGQMPLFEEMA